MRLTHVGTAKDSYNTYEFEVLLQGHIYTLNVKKNGIEVESVWCQNMTGVRKNIRHYHAEVKLQKVIND